MLGRKPAVRERGWDWSNAPANAAIQSHKQDPGQRHAKQPKQCTSSKIHVSSSSLQWKAGAREG